VAIWVKTGLVSCAYLAFGGPPTPTDASVAAAARCLSAAAGVAAWEVAAARTSRVAAATLTPNTSLIIVATLLR
jgi:hypothetical protein